MKLAVCVDDQYGMMFNKRRQSRDKKVTEELLRLAGDGPLWVSVYSAGLFSEKAGKEKLRIDDRYPEKARKGELCFAEDMDVSGMEAKAEEIILFFWNRIYPADAFFNIDLSGWSLCQIYEYAGNSHEKITRKHYKRRKTS